MANVLIIDDELAVQRLLSIQISKQGHSCKTVSSIKQAKDTLEHERFEIVFLDIYMPDGNGIDFIPTIVEKRSPPLVIMITGSYQTEPVENALMKGAWDYVQKPFSLSELSQLIDRALMVVDKNQESVSRKNVVGTIIGSSKPVIKSINSMLKAAESDINVIIIGLSGTGKELFAHELHRHSQRSNNPFVVVDCAVLPDNLIESILFGHVKGAFTGAVTERLGLIQQAEKGTLFLDEIGELPLDVQKKFLRVIQERTIRPIGGKEHIPVDFRLVCATNRDIEKMVKGGLFREDLFHRINVFPIYLPPICERHGDIPLIARFVIEQICTQHNLEKRSCSDEFLEAIEIYNWPGNVRELNNVLEKIILTSDEKIIYPDHLPQDIRAYIIKKSISSKRSVLQTEENKRYLYNVTFEQIEKNDNIIQKIDQVSSNIKSIPSIKSVRADAISKAEESYLKELIEFTQGDTAEAIKISGVAKSQFYRLLKKYNITKVFPS